MLRGFLFGAILMVTLPAMCQELHDPFITDGLEFHSFQYPSVEIYPYPVYTPPYEARSLYVIVPNGRGDFGPVLFGPRYLVPPGIWQKNRR